MKDFQDNHNKAKNNLFCILDEWGRNSCMPSNHTDDSLAPTMHEGVFDVPINDQNQCEKLNFFLLGHSACTYPPKY